MEWQKLENPDLRAALRMQVSARTNWIGMHDVCTCVCVCVRACMHVCAAVRACVHVRVGACGFGWVAPHWGWACAVQCLAGS